METIFQNNDVEIVTNDIGFGETEINVETENKKGKNNLIVVSNDTLDEFVRELKELLTKHRI